MKQYKKYHIAIFSVLLSMEGLHAAGLPSYDDVDSVPQKDQSSVARELSTALDKYKDVSSARFSIQENDPEIT